MLFFILLLMVILLGIFDVYYVFRAAFVFLRARFKPRNCILEESKIPGICLTTDLDLMLHMNNSRYLRECDFGRYDYWLKNGCWHTLRTMGGYFTNGGSTIRYRKSINFLDRYDICTKVLYWDEKAFYLEQKLVRSSDKFIYAIALVKQTVIGVTPSELITKLKCNINRPEPLPELQRWMESNQLSSERLRKYL